MDNSNLREQVALLDLEVAILELELAYALNMLYDAGATIHGEWCGWRDFKDCPDCRKLYEAVTK